MMPALKLCVECGEPCEDGRCDQHRPKQPTKPSARARGYNTAWDKLSTRARTLQPWCSDCGTKDDLTADHLTWPARTLHDVDVVCRTCNTLRGETPRDGRRHDERTGQGAHRPLRDPRGKASSSTQSDTGYVVSGSDRG